ncbi:UNVERIFIED_ORG: sugar phosphate isomerase/epimerase [Xanthobacter viscosus]|jgi:sugar phosphate isomerase/epimerase|uniref:TIM barrel protein n=1 Tax=Xanthobacter autotrophicus TaxID=280 RepID=A0A6C1K9J6_XANAU|nr:sugar phosphate isomerase/epimerase family protein [Xanthobacter autotrophicus]TLX40979.1 TIM barrel protein [Xanthobacter autotrophicus]
MDARTPAAAIAGIGYSIRASAPEFEDLPAKLDEAEALGVDFVELPAFAWTLVVDGRVLEDRLERLVAMTQDRPFGYTVHGPLAINLMSPKARLPRHEALLDAMIAISGALGAVNLVLHTGCVRGDDDVDVAYSRQRDALARAGDKAGEVGVTLCVENIFRFEPMRETALPSRLAGELDALDHPHVRATLDVSHALLRTTEARVDFLNEISVLAPFCRHVHVHDSFGRPLESWTMDEAERLALGEGDLHLPVGWGAIKWDDVAARCRFAPGTVVNLELHRRYWSELPAQIPVVRALAARFAATAGVPA